MNVSPPARQTHPRAPSLRPMDVKTEMPAAAGATHHPHPMDAKEGCLGTGGRPPLDGAGESV